MVWKTGKFFLRKGLRNIKPSRKSFPTNNRVLPKVKFNVRQVCHMLPGEFPSLSLEIIFTGLDMLSVIEIAPLSCRPDCLTVISSFKLLTQWLIKIVRKLSVFASKFQEGWNILLNIFRLLTFRMHLVLYCKYSCEKSWGRGAREEGLPPKPGSLKYALHSKIIIGLS